MAEQKTDKLYDAVIIGGGPAGLTAAIYLARSRYRVIVVEKEVFGGQITITSQVVNYPGVERVSGTELTENMRKQAQSFGAEFLLAEVNGLELSCDVKTVHTTRGQLSCFGILLAAGAHPRMVGFAGEEEFKGHGVAYCATCDGEFFTGKEVFVIGGGFAAAEESVFLTKYASHVTILIREDDFTCAEATADEARNHKDITVLTNVEVMEVTGDSVLRTLKYKNNKTGEVTEYRASEGDSFGVFVFAGYEPATGLVRGLAEVDERGYIITDSNQKTSVDGLYAAGDICVKKLRQVVTAVGDGAAAATELERYASAMQEKTGLHPVPPKGQDTSQEKKGMQAFEKVSGKKAGQAAENSPAENSLFTQDMLTQLRGVFERMERPLLLKLYLDESSLSRELEEYMNTLAGLSDKLRVEIQNQIKEGSIGVSAEFAENPGVYQSQSEEATPCVRVCLWDGTETGLAFHGVPGGHEFTSFVLGLYNASGPGQPLEDGMLERIHKLSKPASMRVLVSLSCTMCPELVTSAQKIAAENPEISAEVYDLSHFPDLKEKYQVMSVPCLIVNEERPLFGKKSTEQLVEMLEKL